MGLCLHKPAAGGRVQMAWIIRDVGFAGIGGAPDSPFLSTTW